VRLFGELRPKISTGDLFDQGGKPLDAVVPFIDNDKVGGGYGYAKPYIIGYALCGLPELMRYAPDEPKLRDVVKAVADFLADSQDPIAGRIEEARVTTASRHWLPTCSIWGCRGQG